MNAYASAHKAINPEKGPDYPEPSGTRRKRPSTVRTPRTVASQHRQGGQHRASVGRSTRDNQSDAEWREDHRRRCEAAALTEFEAARAQAQQEYTQPF